MSLFVKVRCWEGAVISRSKQLSALEGELNNSQISGDCLLKIQKEINDLSASIKEYEKLIESGKNALSTLSDLNVIKCLKSDVKLMMRKIDDESSTENNNLRIAVWLQRKILNTQFSILGADLPQEFVDFEVTQEQLKIQSTQIELNDELIDSLESKNSSPKKRKRKAGSEDGLAKKKLIGRKSSLNVKKVRFNSEVQRQFYDIRSGALDGESQPIGLSIQEKASHSYNDKGGSFYEKDSDYRDKFRIRSSIAYRAWVNEKDWDMLWVAREKSEQGYPIWREEKWGKALDHEYLVIDPDKKEYVTPDSISSLDEALLEGYRLYRVLEIHDKLYVVPVENGPIPNDINTPEEARSQGYEVYNFA